MNKKNILICDTQPVAVEGMKWLIENSDDLRFAGSVPTLEAVYEVLNPGAAAEAASLEAELAQLEGECLSAEALDNEAIRMEQAKFPDTGVDSLECESHETEIAAVPDEEVAFSESLAAIAAMTGEEVSPEPEAMTIGEPGAMTIGEAIDAVVIDKGLGMPGVMELLQKLTSASHPTPAVVWGAVISEAEALRLLQAGARGILRRTSESGTLLTCLRAVTSGGTWMEDGIFGSTDKLFNPRRSQLTHRESEVVGLVEKGLRNRDIARLLGIRTGTVKIHLKHIFEKTGVRGRYGLAFTGLQNKGSITMATPRQLTV
jgi:DNA-binding NarL/FixJ family response regulator